eukprot:jgi/Mesvir1/10892/Mv11171-RA.1
MSTFGPKQGPTKQTGALSKETTSLLEGMLSTSNLSRLAQQQILDNAKRTGFLPSIPAAQKPQRSASAEAASRQRMARERLLAQNTVNLRATTATFSGIRLEHQIKSSPDFEREQYRGGPGGRNNEAEKERLAQVMERKGKTAAELEAMLGKPARPKAKGPVSLPTKDERIDELLQEVEERREFLEEMIAAGRGHLYEAKIKSEISLRLAELKRLGVS